MFTLTQNNSSLSPWATTIMETSVEAHVQARAKELSPSWKFSPQFCLEKWPANAQPIGPDGTFLTQLSSLYFARPCTIFATNQWSWALIHIVVGYGRGHNALHPWFLPWLMHGSKRNRDTREVSGLMNSHKHTRFLPAPILCFWFPPRLLGH